MPGFELTVGNQAAVAAIAQRLDGLPLAIELAAARLRALAPQQIADRLSDRFAVLSRANRTRSERQQTLWKCLDWSFGLCTKPEQTLWSKFAVFAGGAELDAVEGVCADPRLPSADILDLVASLIDKSIVVRTDDGDQARYRMLETVREFGLQKLRESGMENTVRRRHRDWYQQLVTRANQEWISERQAYWVARLGREHPNIRVAVDSCLAEAGGADNALRIAVSLPPLHWIAKGLFHEGRQWLNRALAQATSPTPLRAHAMLLATCRPAPAGRRSTGKANPATAEPSPTRTSPVRSRRWPRPFAIPDGGQLVSLTEVRDVLLDHPFLVAAEVVTRPATKLGRRLVAYVVPASDTAPGTALAHELVEVVQETLGGLARPSTIVFLDHIGDDLPPAARRRALEVVAASLATPMPAHITWAQVRAAAEIKPAH